MAIIRCKLNTFRIKNTSGQADSLNFELDLYPDSVSAFIANTHVKFSANSLRSQLNKKYYEKNNGYSL